MRGISSSLEFQANSTYSSAMAFPVSALRLCCVCIPNLYSSSIVWASVGFATSKDFLERVVTTNPMIQRNKGVSDLKTQMDVAVNI